MTYHVHGISLDRHAQTAHDGCAVPQTAPSQPGPSQHAQGPPRATLLQLPGDSAKSSGKRC